MDPRDSSPHRHLAAEATVASYDRWSVRDFREKLEDALSTITERGLPIVLQKNTVDRAGIISIPYLQILTSLFSKIGVGQLIADDMSSEAIWSRLSSSLIDYTLMHGYPYDYKLHLSNARRLWLVGSNLRRVVPDAISELRTCLDNGGQVTAVFVDPESAAAPYMVKQEYGLDISTEEIDRVRQHTWDYREFFISLRIKYGDAAVDIRAIDYPLSFGLDVIELNDGKGVIYVRYYPMGTGDRPILVLNDYIEPWYDFYKKQLDMCVQFSNSWLLAKPHSK